MIKQLFIGFALTSLVACTNTNTSSEKTITQGDDTVSQVDISVTKTDALVDAVEELSNVTESKLLFKASGSEPGWYAEFYDNKLRLLVNYGQDSLLINDSFVDVYNEKGFNYKGIGAMKEAELPLVISVQNQKCTDMAGNLADRTVTVKLGTTVYKGCGSLLK